MTNPEELERLARAATPGCWGVHEQRPSPSMSVSGTFIHAGPDKADDTGFSLVARTYTRDGLEERQHNAAFIAAANPATILALLSANREMGEMLDLYRVGMLRAFDGLCDTCRGGAVVSERTRSALTTQRGG